MRSSLPASAPAAARDHALLAIASVCAAVAFAGTMDAGLKWLSGEYPLHQILVFRCGIAVPLLLAFGWSRRRDLLVLHPRWPAILLRGLIMCSAFLSYGLALAVVPLADAAAIYFTMPLFVAALAGPVLGERVRLERWLAILTGFAGVLIMIRPGTGVFEPAALFALYAGFGYASGQIVTRWLGGVGVPATVLVFYQNAIYLSVGVAMSLLFGFGHFAADVHPSLAFVLRGWTAPPPADLAVLVGLGFLSAAAMTLFTRAYRLSEANLVAPFEYTFMIWATIYGLVLFGDFPDWVTGLGAMLVIGAGLYMLTVSRRMPG